MNRTEVLEMLMTETSCSGYLGTIIFVIFRRHNLLRRGGKL